MEHNTSNPSNRSRKTLLLGIAVVAIVAVVYFSFFYPPTGNDETSGTIGAAKKYRSEQITDKDVKLEGIQSTAAADQTVSTDVAGDLRNAAESLEKSVRGLQKATSLKLDRTYRDNLEKAAEAATNAARAVTNRPPGRPHATFDNAAAVSLQKDIVALEKSIQEVMGKTVEATLQKTQEATYQKTQEAAMQKAQQSKLEKNQAQMERAAKLTEMNNRAHQVINNVAQFEKTFGATLEKNAAEKE